MLIFMYHSCMLCLNCDIFTCFNIQKETLMFSYYLCCNTSFHPLIETRAQSALIGYFAASFVIGQPLRDVPPLSLQGHIQGVGALAT